MPFPFAPLALIVLTVLAGTATAPAQSTDTARDAQTDGAPAPREVRVVRDLAYRDGDGADPKKHALDLYLPKGERGFPVLMWIHGGGWCLGDRWHFGSVGRRFAEAGVGFAAISYRLTPQVRHPSHVEDCAAAFAWLKRNVAAHGGDPGRLFVAGQSAGGHLTALLALDPRWLRAHDLPLGAIAGAIPMSGVYEVPVLSERTRGPLAMFPAAFGSDRQACRDASPAAHVGNLACPMLVITETVFARWLRASTDALRTAAEKAGVEGIRFFDAERRDHISIVVHLAGKEDPVRQTMLDFVQQRCRELDAKRGERAQQPERAKQAEAAKRAR